MKKCLKVMLILFTLFTLFSDRLLAKESEKYHVNLLTTTENGTFSPEFSEEVSSCKEIIGDNLMAVLKAGIILLRVAAAIIVIVKASLALIPAVQKGDDGAIKAATKQCVSLAIILVIIGILPTLVNVIAKICGFENSCIVELL